MANKKKETAQEKVMRVLVPNLKRGAGAAGSAFVTNTILPKVLKGDKAKKLLKGRGAAMFIIGTAAEAFGGEIMLNLGKESLHMVCYNKLLTLSLKRKTMMEPASHKSI